MNWEGMTTSQRAAIRIETAERDRPQPAVERAGAAIATKIARIDSQAASSGAATCTSICSWRASERSVCTYPRLQSSNAGDKKGSRRDRRESVAKAAFLSAPHRGFAIGKTVLKVYGQCFKRVFSQE